jgi:hypothetical protein
LALVDKVALHLLLSQGLTPPDDFSPGVQSSTNGYQLALPPRPIGTSEDFSPWNPNPGTGLLPPWQQIDGEEIFFKFSLG